MKKNWLTHNWALKLIALILATITWVYANNTLIALTP